MYIVRSGYEIVKKVMHNYKKEDPPMPGKFSSGQLNTTV